MAMAGPHVNDGHTKALTLASVYPHVMSSESVPMTSERVTDLLREAYNDEIETVMNYLANSIVLKGVSAEEIKERLEADVQEELTHAQRLGQRLDELDERPPASFEFEARQADLQPPEDPTDVMAIVDGVVQAENDAIETYRSLITEARDADDPVTEDLAIQLLADEESHRAEFKGFRQEFDG
jgi:bacterioferritin